MGTGFIHPGLHRLRVHLRGTLFGRVLHILRSRFNEVPDREGEGIDAVIMREPTTAFNRIQRDI